MGSTGAYFSKCIGPEKHKFTVSVQGHLWSSARHCHETLPEFAKVIERNAKKLHFISSSDSIQRLQLAQADGSDPEELDIDSTLEDILILKGSKQLVAIIDSPKRELDTIERSPLGSPITLPETHKLENTLLKSDAPSSYSLTPTSAPTGDDTDQSPVQKCNKSPSLIRLYPGPFDLKLEQPHRGFMKPLSTVEHISSVSREDGNFQVQNCAKLDMPPALYPLPQQSRPPGGFQPTFVQGTNDIPSNLVCSSNSAPTPAELASYLVRGSTFQSRTAFSRAGNIRRLPHHCCSDVRDSAGFHPSAPSRIPTVSSTNANEYGQGTPNIAMLAQFLASQLKAFIPPKSEDPHGGDVTKSTSTAKENRCDNFRLAGELIVDRHDSDHAGVEENLQQRHNVTERNSVEQEKCQKISVCESRSDKDESSSSADANTLADPANIMPNYEDVNNRPDPVFLVNRRSKMGLGTHHLRLSNLSAYFHLSVVEAAKKLGVSQTTLKKACRKFGLKRWPGRKVRSLESTIHGLEHTIAVGQGSGMEDLTEAFMRSEVLKLQQEWHQLVHGVPASQQQLPLPKTADLYKRLYSKGWRAKFHNVSGRLDINLNLDSPPNDGSDENLHQPFYQGYNEEARTDAEAHVETKSNGGNKSSKQQLSSDDQTREGCDHMACSGPTTPPNENSDSCLKNSVPARASRDNYVSQTVIEKTPDLIKHAEPTRPEQQEVIVEKRKAFTDRYPKRPRRCSD
ncbi:hypothetical protein O6H91_23G061700 [Diphasiastrum complanatum]|uniref:Uncharacterized protein n=1 Tax=Diphasiastrum complanatum TaxID=34168 RepID=A0ACC2AB64_DIPCM|nr:hypothetical protein O6H91_23G061700 [Diphasiastrum complanatum]